MDLLIYLPNGVKGRVPAFLGLNFNGNHTVQSDAEIRGHEELGACQGQCGKRIRARYQREPLAGGHGVEARLCRGDSFYGDIDPDFDDGFKNGVQPLFYKPGQTRPEANEWGSLGAGPGA